MENLNDRIQSIIKLYADFIRQVIKGYESITLFTVIEGHSPHEPYLTVTAKGAYIRRESNDYIQLCGKDMIEDVLYYLQSGVTNTNDLSTSCHPFIDSNAFLTVPDPIYVCANVARIGEWTFVKTSATKMEIFSNYRLIEYNPK